MCVIDSDLIKRVIGGNCALYLNVLLVVTLELGLTSLQHSLERLTT